MEDEYNLSNIIGKRTEAALGELGDLLWAYVVLSKRHCLHLWRHQLPE